MKNETVLVAGVAALALIGFGKQGGVMTAAGGGTIQLSDGQRQMAELIDRIGNEMNYANLAFLKALALEESSLNPNAQSAKTSYGLFQIFHSTNFSWLRWNGNTNGQMNLLFDPDFNTRLAIRIVRYFEQKHFIFPGDSDIYNVGETEWSRGVRNMDYRAKVQRYTIGFSAGTIA